MPQLAKLCEAVTSETGEEVISNVGICYRPLRKGTGVIGAGHFSPAPSSSCIEERANNIHSLLKSREFLKPASLQLALVTLALYTSAF